MKQHTSFHRLVAFIVVFALGGGMFLWFTVGQLQAAPPTLESLRRQLMDATKALAELLKRPSPAAAINQVPLYKPVMEYEKAVVDAVKKASPAVVSITVSRNVNIIENCPPDPFSSLPPEFRQFFGNGNTTPCTPRQLGTQLQEVGGGSGFLVSADGLIVTNKHVVSDTSGSFTVFTNDGKKYEAKVLARDPLQDIAIMKIEGRFPWLELGDSDSIQLGQSAIAIGNALGEFRNTVSVGVISGLSRTITAAGATGRFETIQGVLQTDAAINPGNSGGPLLNLRGQVIGINTAVAQSAQSVGFAIPINHARNDIESVQTTGKLQLPYIGVRYVAVTPQLAKSENLPVDYGALVRASQDGPAIMPGSPAETAGLRAGDIILDIASTKIDTEHPLSAIVSRMRVGDIVVLKVRRGGAEMSVRMTLTRRPD